MDIQVRIRIHLMALTFTLLSIHVHRSPAHSVHFLGLGHIHVVVSGLANKVQPLRMASSSCTASSVNKYDDMYRLAFTTFSFSFSEFFAATT